MKSHSSEEKVKNTLQSLEEECRGWFLGLRTKNICLHLKHLSSYQLTKFGDGDEEFTMSWFFHEKTLYVKPSNESIRMNTKRVCDIYVEHLENIPVHFTQNFSSHILSRGGPILDLDAFDREGGDNFDFEDENEGPLEKVDHITIDVVDDSTLYNLVSLEGVIDVTERDSGEPI
ncbi:hypothetical protein M9H77_04297 [Catharanthus roseus]|uniref:Uncharacterized protein n=1 Tax=Catharanthus roseus TaxID=4058 RepID=A0ACC0CE51_CATRO|nr:hypothetical protein M9H77_04297 [Catharanthus roseus]